MRGTVNCVVLALCGIISATVAQTDLPQKGAGPGKPLSAKEALKTFHLDDGLRIELVACEPQIESPVAMAFDPQGRLWVVEMRDYPNGPASGQPAQGRIRVLEDRDGDGFYETATTWADQLLFANGLLLWKDGALVTMAPHLAHLRDPHGRGRADQKEILYEGFAAQNPQLRVSHPNLGIDGWVYCANGLRGGKVVSASPASKLRKPIDLSGMDFRFDPLTGAYEAISGQGQFGNTFDAWGNRFVCDNRHHLRQVVMENRYLQKNPYLAAPSVVADISILEDGPLSSGGKVYPISKNWTTSSLHEGRFTAACGVFIYHGKLLGKSYEGAAFTCEPTGNLVHMEVLTPHGVTFQSRPSKQGIEFLATADDWFRPVFLTHGPEGALYIVDMYRAVIEHPDFMPPELKQRPDLWQGKEKGRIWRVVPKQAPTKPARPNLARATIAELVQNLAHDEPWFRTTAQRLLLEKNDQSMIEPLSSLFASTRNPHAKIEAAWLLERRGAFTKKQLLAMLSEDHPRVREHAIRIGESHLKDYDPQGSLLERLVKDADARVRYQAILSFDHPEHLKERLSVAQRDAEDPWTRLAVQCTPPANLMFLCQNYLRLFTSSGVKPNSGQEQMARELAALVATFETPERYLNTYETITLPNPVQWPCLAGLAEGLQRRGESFSSMAKKFNSAERTRYEKSLARLFTQAVHLARDGKETMVRRQEALRILGQASWPTARQALVPVVTEDASVELRVTALRSLAGHQDEEVPVVLVKLWPAAVPGVRREILEALLRQPERVLVLLQEMEAKRIKVNELDPLRARQLQNHPSPAIRNRAHKLLADRLPADREKALKEYQVALQMKGDAQQGREIFKKHCATCHRVAGIGVDVGPDIADTRTKTLQALLYDIIVPNAAIDSNYVNYVVTTKDGRVLTGLLVTETASSITLMRAERQTEVVLRKDIDDISSTGISLMPEGLENGILVQEMADLLHFLKDWRYLDGSVPTGR